MKETITFTIRARGQYIAGEWIESITTDHEVGKELNIRRKFHATTLPEAMAEITSALGEKGYEVTFRIEL